MKQQLKDLINSTMDECYDYSHYQEAILSEDETQCYRSGYIDGLTQNKYDNYPIIIIYEKMYKM